MRVTLYQVVVLRGGWAALVASTLGGREIAVIFFARRLHAKHIIHVHTLHI